MKKILTALTVLMLLAATLAGPAGASEGDDTSGPSTTIDDGSGPTSTTMVGGHDDETDAPDSGDEADRPDTNDSTTTTIVVAPDNGNDDSDHPDGDSVDDSDKPDRADRPGRAEERRRRREEKIRREEERRRKADDSADDASDDSTDSTDSADDSTDDSDRRGEDRSGRRRDKVEERLLRACREDSVDVSADAAGSEACRIIREALANAGNGGPDGEGDLTREEVKNRITEACREATADNSTEDGVASASAAASSSDPVVDDSGDGNDFGRCVRTLRRADARERVVQACRSAVGADSAEVNLDLAE
ncbi:MAG TPA: hypothetical protein ENI86_06325, partial [Acidimicrobiales bacterium]|nr:hypothetical protein [Acidimicrobiales bacterium]